MIDLAPMAGLTLLFKRDSVHVFWPENVELDGNVLHVGDREIKTLSVLVNGAMNNMGS
jgi:glyceraldehyde-3-phosphate dehydrogenase/erythrose-4-phosphate dehydrogenase